MVAKNTDTINKTLSNIPLIASLPPTTRAMLEANTKIRTYGKDDQILERNSDTHDVYFVLSGEVRVVNYSLTGREIALASVGEGSYFGEIAALDSETRSASVVALSKCVLAVMSPNIFLDLVRNNSEVAMGVIDKLTQIVRVSSEKIMDLSVLSAHQRVYRQLLNNMTEDPVRPNSWLIYPLPTQAQIAAEAGTTRETVARVVSQLAQNELVQRKGRTLYIRDPDTLRALTDRLEQQTPA